MEQLSYSDLGQGGGAPTRNWGRPRAVILIAENPSTAAPPTSRDRNAVKQLQTDVCRALTPDERLKKKMPDCSNANDDLCVTVLTLSSLANLSKEERETLVNIFVTEESHFVNCFE